MSETCHLGHNHSHGSNNEKVIRLSFFLTFCFMIVEFVGGWLSGSLALIADAGHMLTDAGALFLAWAGFYFGRRKTSKKKTFGYFRFEVLAALLNAVSLFVLTIWIAYEAYMRLNQPVEIMALPMFAVAVVGLIVNCLVFYILTKGDKGHLNIKGAILHVVGDLLGSIGAVAASVIIYFTNWTPIDSILSLFVCLLIMRSTWSVLKESLHILMEGTPKGVDIEAIRLRLKKISNVSDVSHIHIWAITSDKVMASMNIAMCEEGKIIKTISEVKEVLEKEFKIEHSSIEPGIGVCSL